MCIPVRCFSCSKPLGTKKIYMRVLKAKTPKDFRNIFKDFKIKRYCCRRMVLTNVAMLQKLKK